MKSAASRCAILCVLCGMAAALCAQESRPDSGYYYDLGTKKLPISQCSVNCVVVELAYYDVRPDITAIKQYLHCTRAGASLLAVSNVLEAYGLRVQAVKNITTNRLTAHLTAGGTAIVARRIGNVINHFTPFLGPRRGAFIAVEYPQGTRVFDAPDVTEMLHDGNGIALLISGRAAMAAHASIAVEPNVYDIGTLSGLTGDVDARFVVRNTSASTILVSDVRVACGGCMKRKTTSGWIEPGASGEVVCTVSPARWGYAAKKPINILLADGSSYVVYVKASAFSPELSKIEQSTDIIRIAEADFAALGYCQRELSFVRYDGKPLTIARVTVSHPWLVSRVGAGRVDKMTGGREIDVELTISKVAETGLSVGRVYCYFQGIKDPAIATVVQFHEAPFTVSPAILVMPCGSGQTVSLSLVPADVKEPYEIVSLGEGSDLFSLARESGEHRGCASLELAPAIGANMSPHIGKIVKLSITIRQGGADLAVPALIRVVDSAHGTVDTESTSVDGDSCCRAISSALFAAAAR